MDDAKEQQLRDRIHELADTLNALVTRTEVVAVRLENTASQLTRIDDAVTRIVARADGHTERLTVLETRDADARTVGGRWGAIGGGLIAGLFYALQHLFMGPPK